VRGDSQPVNRLTIVILDSPKWPANDSEPRSLSLPHLLRAYLREGRCRMKNMKHKEKIKLARRLRTNDELKSGVPIFQSENWEKRKEAIRSRVKRIQAKSHQRALERKAKHLKEKK